MKIKVDKQGKKLIPDSLVRVVEGRLKRLGLRDNDVVTIEMLLQVGKLITWKCEWEHSALKYYTLEDLVYTKSPIDMRPSYTVSERKELLRTKIKSITNKINKLVKSRDYKYYFNLDYRDDFGIFQELIRLDKEFMIFLNWLEELNKKETE